MDLDMLDETVEDRMTWQARADDERVASAGEPLPPGTPAADRDSVIAALQTIYDPEIPVNIYDLGLIYDLAIGGDGTVDVEMTLTAPACPVAGELPQTVAETIAAVEGVGEVAVRLVWSPPWTPDRMTEEARLALDYY